MDRGGCGDHNEWLQIRNVVFVLQFSCYLTPSALSISAEREVCEEPNPLAPFPEGKGERLSRGSASCAGEAVDGDAGEGGGFASAFGLEGFEGVHGLVELAAEVGFVADDLCR